MQRRSTKSWMVQKNVNKLCTEVCRFSFAGYVNCLLYTMQKQNEDIKHLLIIAQEKQTCESCAYRESGHVVFAYLQGYSCLEMQIMKTADDEGLFSYSLIDYKSDESIALTFIGEKADDQFFRNLSLAQRLQTIEVGGKLARLFIGGSVATAVFRNNGDAQIPIPMQMDYEDLVKVEYIHQVLRVLMVNSEVDFMENEIAGALYTVSNSYVWNSIDAIAKRLLEESYLAKNDVEECLEKTGLLPLFA